MEGQNADRFRENFANTDWVKVPRVLWEYTTSQVLTMEYTPGVKINRSESLLRLLSARVPEGCLGNGSVSLRL